MSCQVLSFQESLGGEALRVADDGVIRTSANRLSLSVRWPEISEPGSASLLGGDLQVSGAWPMVASQDQWITPVALPESTRSARSYTLRLVQGEETADIPISLSAAPCWIESPHVSGLVQTREEIFLTLAFRAIAEGLADGDPLDQGSGRAMCRVLAGYGKDPGLPQYSASRTIKAGLLSDSSKLLGVDLRMAVPAPDDYLYLAILLQTDWGVQDSWQESVPLRRALAASFPPSRIDYDHAVQEVVNQFPVWSAARARDYLAMAGDPEMTMKGDGHRWLGELSDWFVPYDYVSPPVAQRLAWGLIGPRERAARRAQRLLSATGALSLADTGAAYQIWRAQLPDSPAVQKTSLPSSPTQIVALYSGADQGFELAPPDEIAFRGAREAQAIAPGSLSECGIRLAFRVETDRGTPSLLTSPGWDEQQNLNAVAGVGGLGLVWRRTSASSYYQLGWGPIDQRFGLWIREWNSGVSRLVWADREPRFYPKNRPTLLEIRDSGALLELIVDEQPVASLEMPSSSLPWQAGIWGSPPASGVLWTAFYRIEIVGRTGSGLIGLGLEADGRALRKVDTLDLLLTSPPTRVSTESAEAPASGIFSPGKERDPVRRLVEADWKTHQVAWWCEDNQICKGEADVNEALFRYWLWDGDERRPRTDHDLISCVLSRDLLWVLGRSKRTGVLSLFIVDPATPDPLKPESCLWCYSRTPLDVRGAGGLARSQNGLEVFLR